jgi:hypothetical protein
LLRRLLAILLVSGAALAKADQIDLLQSAGNMLDKHAITTGQFTQAATVAALSAPLVSGGSFYFDHDHGISWHVERPISAQFQFFPTAAGAQAPAPEQSAMSWIGQLLNAVLAGDLSQLSRMFAIDGSVAADRWALALTPKAAALRRALVRIDVDGASTVHRIKLLEANGDDVTITFTDIQYPDDLPADVRRELEVQN